MQISDYWYLVERRLHKIDDLSCWMFLGPVRGKSGYGCVKIGGRKGRVEYTHRIAYEKFKGSIPVGLFVMHLCNNRKCCNPAHLKAGTQTENMQHAAESGKWKTFSKTSGVFKDRGYFRTWGREDGVVQYLYCGQDLFEAWCAAKTFEART